MSTVSWIYLILICAALISVGMYLFKRVVLSLFLLERRDYYQEIIYMICWGCSQTSVERPTVHSSPYVCIDSTIIELISTDNPSSHLPSIFKENCGFTGNTGGFQLSLEL